MTDPEPANLPTEAAKFLAAYFRGNASAKPPAGEDATIQRIEKYVVDGFVRQEGRREQKYRLGLALDFLAVADALGQADSELAKSRPGLDEAALFKRYEQVMGGEGNTTNTLTLRHKGAKLGIRKVEEDVVDLFNKLDKPSYPSAYVYNTGMWGKHKPLLVDCFRLSLDGRASAARRLIAIGIERLPDLAVPVRREPLPKIFSKVVSEYPRSGEGENSGLTLQAIVYGFLTATRPGLHFSADKVRSGSRRQRRLGDVDAYDGIDLALAAEVKDTPLHDTNVDKEVGEFLSRVRKIKAPGMVFAKSFTKKAEADLVARGVTPVSEADLMRITSAWDYALQEAAVKGMLHYLSHIEGSANAVQRLLRFVKQSDPSNRALGYLEGADPEEGAAA